MKITVVAFWWQSQLVRTQYGSVTSPHTTQLHEILDRVLAETKGAEIYGLIDLLNALGFRLAIIPQEKPLEDNSSI